MSRFNTSDVEDVLLEVDVAVPCGLIINKLVSNLLKCAFPFNEEGEVRIKLYSNGDQSCTLIISDNGVGLPKDFNIQSVKTLGLRLVNSLVSQLRGTLKISSGNGTKFEITFTENIS